MQFELKEVKPMNEAERAAYRAANPKAVSKMDASMRALKADLIAEFGQAVADSLMPLI